MKNYFTICLIASILISCNSSQKDSGTRDALVVDTAIAVNPGATQLRDTIATDTLTYNSLIGIEELATDWEMLTKKDGNYVIYEYCDANNSSIHIEQKDNEYIFTHNLGQMAEQYTITTYQRLDALNVRITCVDKYNKEITKTATIVYQESPESGLAEWTWYNSSFEVINPATVYAEKRIVDKFPQVKEENCEEFF